ncbi:MAG: hypothetical protein H2045_07290 [Rhizobiales bacterium]|nr:hypothetical protein [Hyphomicrobiales bacterium]
MRLLQLLALAAFALLTFKLIALAASGAFEGIGVRDAAAQTTDATANGANAAADTKQPAPPTPPAPSASQEGAASQTADGGKKDAEVTRQFPADNRQIGIPGDSRSALQAQIGDRRDELERRERDLKLREELLQAAEKRLQSQITKIEESESSGGAAKTAKENAKDLVTIYESMKPKDAARIFSSLSIGILYKIATAMNPRKLSAIIAEMDVKAAERLTVELAAQAALGADDKAPRALTKIGG